MKYLILAIVSAVFSVFFAYKYLLDRRFPEEITVKRVIDGDTIELKSGRLVRYIGIDAPETRQKGKDGWVFDPQPFALEAKSLNQRLVEGKKIRLEYDVRKEDVHNLLLAYVYVGNTFVNEEMVKQGYAIVYMYPPNVRYIDLLVRAEKEAKNNNRGFWSSVRSHPISIAEARNYIGEVRVVEGRVLTVYGGGKVINLNFGSSRERSFHVTIFRNMLDRFETQGIYPVSYKGKKVKVTGMIGSYRGCPRIIVCDPSQIEVIAR